MNKLKFGLLLIVCSIPFFYGYSQNTNLHYEINWKEKQVFFSSDKNAQATTNKYLFYFDGANYKYNKSFLPVFSTIIKVNSEAKVTRMKNAKFVAINPDELKQVLDLDKVTDGVVLENTLRYNRKQAFLEVELVPIRKNKMTNQFEKLVSFDIELINSGKALSSKRLKRKYANQSVLSSGTWVKIKIPKSGVYKLSFEELRALGINQPENVRIFGNGGGVLPFYNSEENPDDLIENHLLIQNNEVYFYGDGPVQLKYSESDDFFRQQKNLYSDYAYYFLSSDYSSGENNSIITEEQSNSTATHTVNSFTDVVFHELDTANLIGSGRLWVGEHFDFQTDYTFNLNLPNLLAGSELKLETSLLARSPISSSFNIQLAGQTFSSTFASVSYNYTSTYANHKTEDFSSTAGSSNDVTVRLVYNKSTASSEGWLDYLCLNAQRQLRMENEQLHFRNTQTIGAGNVGQFQLANANSSTLVWDIIDPQKPRQISTNLNGSSLNFKLNTDTLREFVAFETSMALSPITSGDDLGLVANQNLHGINQADMVIVSHPNFLDYATELKNLHETNDNLSVALVTTDQVYNEFSSGAPDVSAIRNFMRMLYQKAATESQMPKYLCLFGDGSFDNRHNFSENTNFIPTYQSANSLSPTQSFVTDDYFGLLDDNEGGHEGLLDIGIGRLPVKTRTEAANAMQKIRDYFNIDAYGDWRNRVCFIADDEDGNLHMNQADELSRIIEKKYPVFNSEKIFLDAYPQETSSAGQRYPEAKLAINNQVNKGQLIVNYTGHGNENGLTDERIITIDQINKWSNKDKLPVFMTATCEFSRFDNYEKTTAGEHVFLNPQGGAIALFTTTRLVYASPNFELNKNFYRYIFESNPLTGKRYRLGDIMRLTKIATGSDDNKRNFTLLGDPALELNFARLFVKTNTINQQPANGAADTLKAYDKVVISGEIQNQNGTKISNYNGIVYPVVYDKKQEVKSLNNDGDGIFTYSIRNSQLFKGKASVRNGDFTFNFIVPKDIRYNIDTGKVSYYSSNVQLLNDAAGQYDNIMIGASGTNGQNDQQGPQLQIYLNDESFVDGGITNSAPQLLAFLTDESGINTTGSGIGHDIVATIDNQPDLQFTLNDYYESDIDDFTSGKINYNFPELEPGEHKLHLKAWDVFNNSTQDSITFYVVDSEEFKISHVLNYPNPFSTNTSFFFEHNRPNELLEIFIHVFTVSGKVVKTIHTEQLNSGFRSEGIPWDGLDDFGNKIGRGVYFYKLAVRTPQGEKTDKIEKLLILN